jgi:DNA-binding GntR family transcriptional regulator
MADCLISGRWSVGDRLSLRTVAARLDISTLPVREAALRLCDEGALEAGPRRAFFVPLMDAHRFRDIARARAEIEGFAASLAAQNCTPVQWEEIRKAEAAMRFESRRENPDLREMIAINQALHFAIYRASGSAELVSIIEKLWLRVGPVINLDLPENPDRLKKGEAVRYHAAALTAIEAGDALGARTAIAADIANTSNYILTRGRLPETLQANGIAAPRVKSHR